jgi:hypothetical protein
MLLILLFCQSKSKVLPLTSHAFLFTVYLKTLFDRLDCCLARSLIFAFVAWCNWKLRGFFSMKWWNRDECPLHSKKKKYKQTNKNELYGTSGPAHLINGLNNLCTSNQNAHALLLLVLKKRDAAFILPRQSPGGFEAAEIAGRRLRRSPPTWTSDPVEALIVSLRGAPSSAAPTPSAFRVLHCSQ